MTALTKVEKPARRRFFASLAGVAKKPDSTLNWTKITELESEPSDVLWAGWADGSSLFIVGDEGCILHFDGDHTRRMAAPSPVPIHAIWGQHRNDLFAVGWMGVVYHFDGDCWHQQRGCLVGPDQKFTSDEENTPLFSVTGNNKGQVWTVGDNGVILRFENGTWSREDSKTQANLRAVTVLPSGKVIAAGAGGAVLVRALDGNWSAMPCPIASNFQSVLALSDDRVYLAGGRYVIEENGFRGDLICWSNDRFDTIGIDEKFSRFRSLIAHGDGVLAVGDRGQAHLVSGNRTTQLATGTRHDLLGLIGLQDGAVLAVGDLGVVLASEKNLLSKPHTPSVLKSAQQNTWEPMASGVTCQLWGVWHDARTDFTYVCGEDGAILRHQDGRWQPMPLSSPLGVHALCAAPDGGLFAAGQLGEIHHYDGTKWRKHFDLHMDITILSLWSDGQGKVFAVGDEGLILVWDGGSWQRMNSGTKSALYGLWGPDRDHLLGVGDFGLVLRWNGRQWDEFYAGTEHFIFDVWGRALDDIFVVGLSGTIAHFNGRFWSLMRTRTQADLLAVSGGDRGVFAVGTAGTVLRYADGVWNDEQTGFDGGLRAVFAGRSDDILAVGDRGAILRRVAAK